MSKKKVTKKKVYAKKATGRPVAKKRTVRKRDFQTKAVTVTPLDIEIEDDGKVRLNKFLASAGICSRRAADELIRSGRVELNGAAITALGTRIDPHVDQVIFDGEKVQQEKSVYVLFNKPVGVVCTNARNEQRERVIDYLDKVKGRIYTIGRLDAESEGLILLTNDGALAQIVAHPSHGVTKQYAVLVRGRVEDEALKKIRGGVWLSEGRTGGARVQVERRSSDRTYLKVTIQEGRNRELRRVFAKMGNPVLTLKRIRIGGLNLHGLRSGKFRFLTKKEVEDLYASSGKEPS